MAESICLKCEHKYVCATGKYQPRENTTIMGCSRFVERTPFTNADRIRAMSDEELSAEFIVILGKFGFGDREELLDWLKQEVDDG